MKSKGTTQKNEKRLFGESLLLSCLGRLSARLIFFLKASVFSRILKGAEASDRTLAGGFAGSVFKSFGIKRRFARNVKARFALSAEESVIAKRYRSLLKRLVRTPMFTFGAFSATLGVYVCLVYFLKLQGFGALRAVPKSSFYTGCALSALSLPLLFSRKPLVKVLRESAFAGELFRGVFDLDPPAGEKRRISVGAALILGSVSGVLTFFCGERKILLCIAAAVYLLLVFHSPEFGLLTAAALFPFCPEKLFSALIIAAFLSYVIKVLRGKRNFRTTAANLFVLILGLCFFFACVRKGGSGARFALCMTALCLLASNLLTTPALLKKCVLMVSLGFGAAIAVYALQVFVAALGGEDFRNALTRSHSVFASAGEFSVFLTFALPFVYCKVSDGSFFLKLCCAALAAGSIVYSAANGNAACAVLIAAASFLYLAVKGRRLFRPLVLCFGAPAGILYFADVPISFGGTSLYDTAAGWSAAFRAGLSNFATGVGMADRSVALAFAGDSHSLYLQIFVECGAAGFILLVLALYFAFQRVYAHLSPVGGVNRAVTAAAGASAIIGFLLGTGTNLWANREVCCVFWLALGLAGAAYESRKSEIGEMTDGQ